MLKTQRCPKCQHNHILVIASVPDTGEYESEIRELNIATIFLGDGWLGDKKGRAGSLGATVCKACGYAELHVANPSKIPVDGRYVRELVGPQPKGPFR